MRTPVPITAIAAALLAVSLASIPVVAAKGDSRSLARHPLAGAWLIDATPHDESDPLELLSFENGGVVTNPGAGGLGTWRATDKRAAEATILLPSSDPEAGFAGFITIRASLEVAADGQTFAGTYTLQLAPGVVLALGLPDGQLGPGEVTAQRIVVEPMGDPVGPIPALGQAAPDASPTE